MRERIREVRRIAKKDGRCCVSDGFFPLHASLYCRDCKCECHPENQ